MRILLIAKFDDDSFGSHIRDTFINMGHEVHPIEYGIKYTHQKNKLTHQLNKIKQASGKVLEYIPQYNNLKFTKLIKQLNGHYDLTVCTHDFLTPDEVTALKKTTKSIVVLWFPDAIVNFGKAMFLDADYDALFFKDPYISKVLNNDFNKRVFYLPECCNPECHKPTELNDSDISKYGCDITTAGNFYTNRSAFFKQLIPLNYSVKIWGNPPARWMQTSPLNNWMKNEYVTKNEKCKAYKAAKIVLNNLHPGEIDGINCRAFEIAACGGFQIISYRPAIEELFIPDKEIVYYLNYDDLVEKLHYYLNNDEKRKEISENAFLKASKKHTYFNRLSSLIEKMFN